ncbi:MAG TPA: hypothetical protein VMS17_12445, partial [Gemmataceae bacterium]|nr:hypothetical protein [Gemmataceae bacterium]
MKRFTGLCAGVLTVVLGGGAALAQPVIAPGGCATPPPPCQAGPGPCTAPNPSGAEGAGSESNPYPSMNPSQSAEAAPGAGNEAPPTPEGSGAAFANEGAPRAGATGNTMTAGGTGLASATATGGVTTNQTAFGNNGLILPGLLTAAQVDGAVPANRLFVDYGYFNEFRSVAATATLTPAARGTLQPTVQSRTIDGFNLNRYDFGVEKTFFNGCASVMVRAPILEAADNVAGQPIDGFGDVEAGIKCEILRDCETGDALTGGCDVAIPTGRAETFTVAAFNNG